MSAFGRRNGMGGNAPRPAFDIKTEKRMIVDQEVLKPLAAKKRFEFILGEAARDANMGFAGTQFELNAGVI